MKNKKKKSVFLAGLMVLIMMVSLLSGINLGAAKAEDGSANVNAATRNIFVNLNWSNMKNVSLSEGVSVTVVLTAKDGEKTTEEEAELTKASDWKYTFSNKPIKSDGGKDIEYSLTVKGIKEEDSTVKIDEKEFKVTTSMLRQKDTNDLIFKIENEYAESIDNKDENSISIIIKKEWKGAAPTDKAFELKFKIIPEGGRAIPVEMTLADNWVKKIEVKKNDNGKPIKYTVSEVSESKAFNKVELEEDKRTVEGEDKTITFTNERVERLLNIEKKWIGNEGAAVEFVINGNENDVITLRKSDNGWKTTKSLPVYNLEGKPIDYEITERATRGYTTDGATKKFTLVDKNGNPADASVSFTNTEIPSSDSSTVVNDVISVPSTPTVPEAIPVIPVSDVTPTVTTPETTPTVTVPDDATPQGDANVSNGNTKAETTDEDTDNNEDVDDNDNNDKDVVDVDEDDIPQGEAKVKKDTSKEAPVKVEEDVTPKGSANLPKTGGTMGGFLSLIGMGLIGLALAIRKRK